MWQSRGRILHSLTMILSLWSLTVRGTEQNTSTMICPAVLRARGERKNKTVEKRQIIRWIMTPRFDQNREIFLLGTYWKLETEF